MSETDATSPQPVNTPFQGNINTPGVFVTYDHNSPKYTEIIHSHYGGLLSIFSPADLKQLYGIIANNSVKKDDTFIFGLVTKSGTQYILKFKDAEQFLLFGYIHLSDNIRFENFSRKYKDRLAKDGYESKFNWISKYLSNKLGKPSKDEKNNKKRIQEWKIENKRVKLVFNENLVEVTMYKK